VRSLRERGFPSRGNLGWVLGNALGFAHLDDASVETVLIRRLNRAFSTVSREVARHCGRARYRASEADQQAWGSALAS